MEPAEKPGSESSIRPVAGHIRGANRTSTTRKGRKPDSETLSDNLKNRLKVLLPGRKFGSNPHIMNQTADQEFLEYLVKSLVDHPDDVKVDRKVDEMGVLLSLKVNAMDMGQVVGRQGATAKAIRSLLRIVGIKNNARVNLKIEEPDGAAPRAPRPDRPSADRPEMTS